VPGEVDGTASAEMIISATWAGSWAAWTSVTPPRTRRRRAAPRHRVFGAQEPAHAGAGRLQQAVADVMSAGVVDELETIEV